MKQKIKQIWNFSIDKRILAIFMVLVMAVVILPVARIMLYSVPWYDDFGYGRLVKYAVDNGGGFFAALQGAVESAKSSYYSWQGTFSSCFMMSMMPAVWGTDKYVFGLWFILLALILSIFALVSVLLKTVLKADKWYTLTVQAIVIATCVLLFRSPIDGLFWYNAGVHYTGMHSLGILLIALLIQLIYTEKKLLKGVLLVVSIPFAFFIGGANYVTMLQMGLMVLSLLGWGVIFRKKEVLWSLPAGVSMAAAMILNVTAPGNRVRSGFFTQQQLSPVEAILKSFQSAVTYFDDFTGWMTLAILVMMMPLVILIVSKTAFRFRYPGLVLLWSFCLYATGFTPTLYTMGHTLMSRANNVTMLTFQLLLFTNVFYLTGWLCHYLKEKKQIEVTAKNSLCFYLLMGLVILGVFAAEPNKGGKFTTYVAYYFVHTGEAYNYHQEYLMREEICKSDEADVVVRPYVFKPWVLCLGDLSSDANYEPNQFMAMYFGKNSITCLSQEEEQAMQE